MRQAAYLHSIHEPWRPAGPRCLVHAGDHDAHAIGRGADATALVATDLSRSTDRRTPGLSHLIGRFTKNLDATAAKRSTDPATFVAAILSCSTNACTTRLTRGLLRRAVLIGAHLTETHAPTARFIAAVLVRTAHHLIARLAYTEVLGAWDGVWDADAAAPRATGRALDAENRRAGVLIDRHTDPGAVRAARGRIATVARNIDAHESIRTRKTGQSAAHAARGRDLREAPPLRCEGNDGASEACQHAAPGARFGQCLRPPIELSVVHRLPSTSRRSIAACAPSCQRVRSLPRSWRDRIHVY